MSRVTARFTVPLASSIQLRGDGSAQSYSVSFNGFDAQLTLVPIAGMRSRFKKKERLWTYASETVIVTVSRDEPVAPPPAPKTASGGPDMSGRVAYFGPLGDQYSSVAWQILQNAITFLRFQLRQPVGDALAKGLDALKNPEWFDDKGQKLSSGIISLTGRVITGSRAEFGAVNLEGRHARKLRAALVTPKATSLHLELLSDAQAATFDGNIRRAVLELAIACEVFAKHSFIGEDAAAQVTEALEDRGKIHLRVLDLIEVGGAALKGRGFSKIDPTAYTDIDHLFRARNKVAHRGEPTFRDDQGELHSVNKAILKRWWRSVDKLFEWAK